MRIRVREHMVEPDLIASLKKGLATVEDKVASSIKSVEDGDAWLTCEISGTLDERITDTDDPEYYYIDEYEPEEGEDKVIVPALRYYLSAYPGYYDDDGKYLGNYGLDTKEFIVDIEVAPDRSDFHVKVKGDRPLPVFSLSFDGKDVGYAVERIVESIRDELYSTGLSD